MNKRSVASMVKDQEPEVPTDEAPCEAVNPQGPILDKDFDDNHVEAPAEPASAEDNGIPFDNEASSPGPVAEERCDVVNLAATDTREASRAPTTTFGSTLEYTQPSDRYGIA